MDIRKLAQEIIEGKRLMRGDDLSFFEHTELDELCRSADEIRKALCGEEIDLCSIINGRSGRCSEDCRFCAQSAHYHTGVEEYNLLDSDLILADCKKHVNKGVHRYSIVTAGRDLKGKDLGNSIDEDKEMLVQMGFHI